MSHGDPNYPGNVPFTAEEMKVLRNKPSTSEVLNVAHNLEKQRNFNVGDTLIAVDIKRNEPYKDSNGQSQKFIVKHKDPIGLLYCRRVNADGKLSKGIELIAGWDYERWNFIQDPDVAEHIILGNEEDYNPLQQAKQFKKLKDQIARSNRKIRIKFKTPSEVEAWAKNNIGKIIFRKYYDSIDHYEIESVSTSHIAVNVVSSKYSQGKKNLQLSEFTVSYYEYFNEKPRLFKEESSNV